ncbi:MAG TPA: hypothetical protein VGH88_19425 [Streptosporangiaceae bacterium]|jgi:hypothetical protein
MTPGTITAPTSTSAWATAASPSGTTGATAAVSQAALDAGIREVVLYTDLANPTSNALYKRLGYAPVEDRVVLTFEPAATLHP